MFFIFPRMAPSRASKRLLLLWATVNTISVNATPMPTRTTSSPATSATSLTLSSDVTNFIPSCALSCFRSFVEINYNTGVCGTSPSLECLCQHTGSTGYTIGEGATECIVAEDNINNCHNAGYGSETVNAAYGMCNNIANAAPETHATLVATLVINSGSIVVASPTKTPPATNQTSSSIVVTPTPTSSSSSSSSTSSTSSSTTVAPAAVTSSTAAPTTQSTAPPLSQAQIGGIAGGIAAVAVLAALLALFILLKRRHAQRNSPAFARMRESSWSPKRIQGSPGDGSLSISQPHYQEPKVMSFTRALAKRISSKPGGSRQQQQQQPGPSNGFGLAISPGGGRVPGTGVGLDHVMRSPVREPGPVIRNVPSSPPPPPMSPVRAVSSFNFFPQEEETTAQASGKPTLPRLAIPQRASSHGGRDSVITEFAEDGEDGLGSAQIWRPPNTDPQSASTYYVADKWGNWVLRDERDMTPPEAIAELATPISKTAEERARERDFPIEESAAVQALRRYSSTTGSKADALPGKRANGAPGGGDRPTIRLVTPETGRLPVNSRVRSNVNVSNNASTSQQVAPGPDVPTQQSSSDQTLFHHGDRTKGTRKPGINDNTRRPPSATTVMSQESTTTIADSPVDDMINAVLQSFPRPSRQTLLLEQQQGDLSPVIESPGRSPVQYPAIPRSQSITVNKRRSHTPRALPNPMLARIKQGAVEPAKDSPTLGVMGPVARSGPVGASTSSAAPSRAKTSHSQGSPEQYANQRSGTARKASPNVHARKPSDRALLPSQSRMSSYDAYNDPSTTGAPMPSMYAYPSQPPAQRRTPSPGQVYSPAAAAAATTTRTTQQRTISPPQQLYMPSPPSPSEPYYTSAVTSPTSHYPSTNPSMNSALLAKRIGAERAAEFHIQQQQQQQRYAQEQDKWARQNARQAAGERYVEMPSLPATPGWKPQLTPKRQGDDLYLSVK